MTESKWYKHEGFGCWYKLDAGRLLFSPMNPDGSRSQLVGEVEYSSLDTSEVRELKNIATLLRVGIYAQV